MVEQFVEEILNDADLNIQSIPDSVEKQIYLSTVKIALNAVYKGLSSLHGMDVVGHKMIVRRLESLGAVSGIVREVARHHEGLELVADRLLANPAVNQKLVPDFVERKLYINCLQLLFRLLDSLAATFRITVCGHDVRVSFEAIKDENGKSISVEERAQKLSSSLTPLDLDAVASFARESGAAPEEDKWYDVLGKGRRALVSRLHTTLYALVLGIIDDFLSNTVMRALARHDYSLCSCSPPTQSSRVATGIHPRRDVRSHVPIGAHLSHRSHLLRHRPAQRLWGRREWRPEGRGRAGLCRRLHRDHRGAPRLTPLSH